ncbi:MAG TPA: hypothetical protein VFU46_02335 [Gemmatimonadales bacterium]|nr:hypothetical protein [Gemmatimonadales bacterium]
MHSPSSAPSARRRILGGCAIAAAILIEGGLTACSDQEPAPTEPAAPLTASIAPAPGALVSVGAAGIELWPYLAIDLETADDPVSVILSGEADPRRIRAALLSLDGNRFALPPPFTVFALFDCTWTDGIGDEQAAYVGGLGWSGSAIQLECGNFGPAPRFHVRIFDAGGAVLLGAHFEIQVPGTTDHEVLNFDLAKGLVVADLLRAGIIGLPTPTSTPIAALARTIREPVYDALVNHPVLGPFMPLFTGGPDKDAWNAADPKPPVIIPNDGHPLIAPVVEHFGLGTGTSQSFVIELDQTIPKPFCAVNEQLAYVNGPVRFNKQVTVQPDGRVVSEIRIDGEVTVTPVLAPGEAYRANVGEMHRSWLTADAHSVHWLNHQILLPARTSDRGNHRVAFHVASGGPAEYKVIDRCGGSH